MWFRCSLSLPWKNPQDGTRVIQKKKTDALKEKYHVLPLCGEQIGGLPTPRPGCDVVDGRVISRDCLHDFTEEYTRGADNILRMCKIFDVKRAYLLKDSPMCGRGYGILALKLEEAGIKMFDL